LRESARIQRNIRSNREEPGEAEKIIASVPTVKTDHAPTRRASGKSQKLRVHAKRSEKSNVPWNQENTIAESRSHEAPEGKLQIWEYVKGKGCFHIACC